MRARYDGEGYIPPQPETRTASLVCRHQVMPLLSLIVSVLVILAVGLATDLASPFVGSVISSAPTGTPLALFLAYSGEATRTSTRSVSAQNRLVDATAGLVSGTLYTLAFALCARAAARSGFALKGTLLAGYTGYFCALLCSKVTNAF